MTTAFTYTDPNGNEYRSDFLLTAGRAFCSCLCNGCNPPGDATIVHCRSKRNGCG